jgi:hypothetical protein
MMRNDLFTVLPTLGFLGTVWKKILITHKKYQKILSKDVALYLRGISWITCRGCGNGEIVKQACLTLLFLATRFSHVYQIRVPRVTRLNKMI